MNKFLVLVATAVIAYLLWAHFSDRLAVDRPVSDGAYDSIRPGMSPREVQELLGDPNEVTNGAVEQPEEATAVKTLAPLCIVRSLAKGHGVLHIYRINKDESIWVLFVRDEVASVSYYVDDIPVLYTAAHDEIAAKPTRVWAVRTSGTDAKIAAFLRRRALAASALQRTDATPSPSTPVAPAAPPAPN